MHKLFLEKRTYLIFIIIFIVLDQITKAYFISALESSKILVANNVLNFVHVWNKGISFGAFGGLKYSNAIFLFISGLITLAVIFLLFKEKSSLYSLSYSLIIGGAIGNMLDRVRYGGVFDFIDFHISHYHWPAFNLADSFIFVGAFIFLYRSFFIEH